MKPVRRFAFLLPCVLLLTGPLGAQTPTWTAEVIGPQPPTWSSAVPRALNDAGQIVGTTYVDFVKHGFIGSPEIGLQLLPMPEGATYADANDINASGVVVGFVTITGVGGRGVIWKEGPSGYEVVVLPAGEDGTFPFDARAINDRGDVVGKYGLFGSYVWNEADGTNELTTYPDIPEDINNQRQILGGTYRMDIDTMVVEDLGNPTGTGFNYIFSELAEINDAGECGGYGNVATGMSQSKQAVRFTDGVGWKTFNIQPLNSANVLGIAATGDSAIQLGIFGHFIYVEGFGSVATANTVDPSSGFDLSNSFPPLISRGGRVVGTGGDTVTGEGGIVLLTPAGFLDLGGASAGALGTPILTGYGDIAAGQPTRLRLAAGNPNRLAFLAGSTNDSPFPAYGGIFHPAPPFVVVTLTTDSLGRIDLNFPWPNVPVGTQLYIQAGVVDAEALTGVALSNGLLGVTQ